MSNSIDLDEMRSASFILFDELARLGISKINLESPGYWHVTPETASEIYADQVLALGDYQVDLEIIRAHTAENSISTNFIAAFVSIINELCIKPPPELILHNKSRK